MILPIIFVVDAVISANCFVKSIYSSKISTSNILTFTVRKLITVPNINPMNQSCIKGNICLIQHD